MNQEKFELALKRAHEAKDDYLTACRRWFERSLAWEMIVVAHMTDGMNAQDAWYRAGATAPGKDALVLLRDVEIQKQKAKYCLELAICELKGIIELK